ncbi:hypothetical protein LCM20_09600 [Halobacillus litoralis]|uniref:hypothetical protein n=1 Tax=Halobacillus litoralis TaxID=45668 RepID=UPI001CD35B52|nr:hypothetical protein [Halobacillus litoralis]MCA0970844.1 hypothetical protein [Halobacillus litoralis]
MKRMLRASILFFVFLLSGCIGENYDFTPPSVSVSDTYGSRTLELEEANINWNSDKTYTKETEDIISLAKDQEPVYFEAGEQASILFDSQDFMVEDLSAYVWQDESETDLQVKDREFSMPEEEGEYVMVVDLVSDSGTAQYVGNIVIFEE